MLKHLRVYKHAHCQLVKCMNWPDSLEYKRPPPRIQDHPPPPPTTLWKFQLSFIHFFKFFGFTEPPPPRKFQSLLWGEYGYFLELHNDIWPQLILKNNLDHFFDSEEVLQNAYIDFATVISVANANKCSDSK